ncbi:MAG: carboxypeptidase regulatory-like domain-containing protein [Desulfobulbaceae bacterium]|nr:carboxypeptidase regulatory-like domain-containing protein [Desulfobulbaceae bacterium]MCK5405565.1 carboxypeptidase regulatory-like domain-containing protein [Desulfobulbaceae bacterium]
MRPFFVATLFVTLCSLFSAGPATAHKVNIFAYVEGDTGYTESYFPDGKPVEGGTIEVLGPAGNKLLEGKTDQEGLFSFPLPAKDDLTIVINASMGHKSKFLLKKSDR